MVNSSKDFKTSIAERGSYGFYFFGQNIYYFLLSLYMVTYFTDVGIPALIVSGISLIVKVWDAVNDPIFGGIVDKVNFKKGKFLPWLRISLIFIPITTIFLFAIPSGLSVGIKAAWACIGYILWDAAYTVCDIPIFGLVTTLTDVQQERTSLNAIGRVFAMFATLLVAAVIPALRSVIGGWLPTTIIFSLIALITMFPVCVKAKERIQPKKENQAVNVGLREMLKYIVNNKYLLIYYLAFLINGAFAISSILGLYFARYNLGNESMMTVISLITVLPGILAGVIVPSVCKKFDKFKVYIIAFAANVIFIILRFFGGYHNMFIFFFLTALAAVPAGFTSILSYMFTPDCAEYGHFKTGYNCTGIAFALQTFSAKLNSALATAMSSLALALTGFVSGEEAVQAAGFPDKLWFVITIIPAVGGAIALFILTRYKLNDHDVQLMAQFNAGEITKAEAESKFINKY